MEPIFAPPAWCKMEFADKAEVSAESIQQSIKVEKEGLVNPTGEHLLTHEPLYEYLSVKSNVQVPTPTANESSVCNSQLLNRSDVNNITCEFCGKALKIRAALNYHMHNVHPYERLLLCDLCHKPFENKNALFTHMLDHDGVRLLQCDLCHKVFKDNNALFRHLLTHSNAPSFKCEMCDNLYTSKAILARHVRNVHQSRFACDVCKEAFSEESALNHHKLSHAKMENFSYEICQSTFKQKSSLDNHMLTHSDAANFKCKHCNAIFKMAPAFIRHVLDIHQSDRRFHCEGCKEVFRQRFALIRHMKKHAKEKHFKCKICLKRFKTTIGLKKHMFTHHPEARHFKCELCASSYKTESTLHIHIHNLHSAKIGVQIQPRTESDDRAEPHTRLRNRSNLCFSVDQSFRPFRCDGCGKLFTAIEGFQKHMLEVHSGKNWECKLCNMRFKTANTLKVHNRIAHTAKNTEKKSESKITPNCPSFSREKRKFRCDLCGKGFKTRSGLQGHNRFTHRAVTSRKCEPKNIQAKDEFHTESEAVTIMTKEASTDRVYTCDRCKAVFRTHGMLTYHKRGHSRPKRFKCMVCPKRCKRREGLQTHMLVAHPEIVHGSNQTTEDKEDGPMSPKID